MNIDHHLINLTYNTIKKKKMLNENTKRITTVGAKIINFLRPQDRKEITC